ncbi:UNVERIFIED_CONTAM: hypothetical protein FKN15_072907 [Acipenser sinensis]
MFQHLKKILGDKIYTELPNAEESYLPSPYVLKGKILLKAKKLAANCTSPEGDVTDEDEGAEMSQRVGNEAGEQPNVVTQKTFQLSKDLSDMVSLCKSVTFKDFQLCFQNQKYWETCSFNEVLATSYANEHPGDFVNYNKKFLARVYPSPMRIDSSNMNPQDFWKCGCQIVAMNFQTPGLMMDLNIGWFRQNGNCGYVLRPAIMREEVSYFSANTKDSVPGVSPQLLHIKIISGQNFPKPKGSGSKGDVVDPYVYVEIHGIPADCAEQRTKTVNQNGDNPIFDESFEFQINLPELAMVRFVVLDDDYIGDEFIGQYTIPFECLQPGFRHVPLQSLTGEMLPHAWIFVHVAITNRRGGGKPHKRGLSVRKGKKSREYATMRILGIKAVDEVFKNALQPLREATDLRENMQGQRTRVGANILHVVSESVGAPTTLEMETIEELIAMIKRNTAAQQEQNKKRRVELGLPEPEPTDLDRLLQKWKVELPSQEAEEEELPLPEPRGEELPLPEPRGNAIVPFKELCGLSAVANLMQCILALSTRLMSGDNAPYVLFNLTGQFPTMEPQGLIPEMLKKSVTAYDAMIQTSRTLIENADGLYEKIMQCQKAAMEFHENLHLVAAKEGLKGRKLQKAVESFTWNITILKGQADLLKHAKNEVLENLKQIHYAVLTCDLSKISIGSAESSKPRRSLGAIPEKITGDDEPADGDH